MEPGIQVCLVWRCVRVSVEQHCIEKPAWVGDLLQISWTYSSHIFLNYSTDAEEMQLWFTLTILTELIRNSESRFFGSLMTIIVFTSIASFWPVINPRQIPGKSYIDHILSQDWELISLWLKHFQTFKTLFIQPKHLYHGIFFSTYLCQPIITWSNFL